jgi:hypothetical protein
VQNQRRDVDLLDVLVKVVQPGEHAGHVTYGDAPAPAFELLRTVSSLTRLPR